MLHLTITSEIILHNIIRITGFYLHFYSNFTCVHDTSTATSKHWSITMIGSNRNTERSFTTAVKVLIFLNAVLMRY